MKNLVYTPNVKNSIVRKWNQGDLVAFDNFGTTRTFPFLVFQSREQGLWHLCGGNIINYVIYANSNLKLERRVCIEGYALGLWPTTCDGRPVYEKISNVPPTNAYYVDRILLGRQEITDALASMRGFSQYAEMIDQEKLIFGRGFIGTALAELPGARAVLPNPVRFSNVPGFIGRFF